MKYAFEFCKIFTSKNSPAFFLLVFLAGCSQDPMVTAIIDGENNKLCVEDNDLGLDTLRLENGQSYVRPGKSGGIFGISKQKADVGKKIFDSLVDEGYVVNEPRTVTVRLPFGVTNNVNTHAITDKGKSFLSSGDAICIGTRKIKEITEFTEPADMGGMTITEVSFNYDIDYSDQSRDIGLPDIIPSLSYLGSGKAKAMLVKTNNGWRLEGKIKPIK